MTSTPTTVHQRRQPEDFDLDDLDDLDAVAARARELMAEHDYHALMAASAQRDANDLVALLDLAAAVRTRRQRTV